jgi:carbamoyl-phosphate synthase large subunit
VPDATALVTGVSGETGQGIVKGLRRLEPSPVIVGVDWTDDNAGFRMVDVGRTVPGIADPGYVETLKALIAEHDVDVLLPGIDGEVELLAPRRAELEALGCRVAVSETALVARCADKLETPGLLLELGLEAPRTLACERGMEVVLAELGLPLVLKPRRGNGSQGVHVVRDRSELEALWPGLDPGYCAQEYIEGPEYTCSLLFDETGALEDHLVMERALAGGRTMRGTVVCHEAIEGFIARFGANVRGAVGAINLQLRVAGEGRVLVFEINPRLSGSTAMRVAAGYNEPARLFEHLAHGAPIRPEESSACTVHRYFAELVEREPEEVAPLEGYETVLWDCGDTLLTLAPSKESICLEALARLGIRMDREAVEMAYRMLDFSMKQHASALESREERRRFLHQYNTKLAEALGVGASAEAFDATLYETFGTRRRWVPFPGAGAFLERLGARAPMHVVANWDDGLGDRLGEAGLAEHFAGIHDSRTLGVEKPDPEIFRRFAERTGVDLSKAVYIGNEYGADVAGSRAAGLTPVLLDWRGHYPGQIDAPRAVSWDSLGSILGLP